MSKKKVFYACCILFIVMLTKVVFAEEIECRFILQQEEAEIGKPYTIQYELSGGSGDYTNVTMQALFPYRGGLSEGGQSQSFSGKTGSWTLIPQEGEKISFQIYGNDSDDRFFYIWGPEVPSCPNRDYAIDVTFNQKNVQCGEMIEAAYTINGTTDQFKRVELCWVVVNQDQYTYHVNESIQTASTAPIMLNAGASSLETHFGDRAYFVIEAEAYNGDFIYYESDFVTIEGAPTCDPISVSFSAAEDVAYIGQPFSIHYELSGGSGDFPDVSLQILSPYRGGMSVGGKQVPFTSGINDYSVTPSVGKTLSFQIHGHDSYGQYFYFWGPEYEVRENPDYPVSVVFSKDRVAIGETLTVQYDLGNVGPLQTGYDEDWSSCCEYFWIVSEGENEYTYRIGQTEFDGSKGSAAYAPTYGDALYFSLRAKTKDGHYIYVDRGPVYIDSHLTDHEYEIVLPTSAREIRAQSFYQSAVGSVKCSDTLRTIGSQAFGKCENLKWIFIPKSVESIAADAFDESPNVIIVCEKGSAAESYAIEHDLLYESY